MVFFTENEYLSICGCYVLSSVTAFSKEKSASETSVTISQSARRNIPEDLGLHWLYFESLKSGFLLVSGLQAKF
jgi:hypothetical protein